MAYQVSLPEFEGPLDLLLHLIDANELDIYDIPIAFITGQYMDYLRKAEDVDLNLSGDFMVMAGTLLVLKAKMLLPKRAEESAAGEGTPDPREELVEKLLAYRLYKESADELQRLESGRTKIYFREVSEKYLLSLFPRPNPVGKLGAKDLYGAFREILRLAAAREQVITLRKDAVSVRDRMGFIMKLLSGTVGGLSFTGLLESCDGLREMTATFLALLELLAKGAVWVRQEGLFGEIYIGASRRPDKEERALESVSAGD